MSDLTRNFIGGKISLFQIEYGKDIKNILDYFQTNKLFLDNFTRMENRLNESIAELKKYIDESIQSDPRDYSTIQKDIINLKKDMKNVLFSIVDKVDKCELSLYRRKDILITIDDLDTNLQARLGGSSTLDFNRLMIELRNEDKSIKKSIGIDEEGYMYAHPVLLAFSKKYTGKNKVNIVDMLNFLFTTIDYKTLDDYGKITDSNPTTFDRGSIKETSNRITDNRGYVLRKQEQIIDIYDI